MFDPAAFSSDFELVQVDPDPAPADDTPDYPDEGPWMSHGTLHLSRPPKH